MSTLIDRNTTEAALSKVLGRLDQERTNTKAEARQAAEQVLAALPESARTGRFADLEDAPDIPAEPGDINAATAEQGARADGLRNEADGGRFGAVFDCWEDIATATIADGVMSIEIRGYFEPGDGGRQKLVRTTLNGSEDTTSNGGTVGWKREADFLLPQHFGAIPTLPGAVPRVGSQAKLQRWINYCAENRIPAQMTAGSFLLTDQLRVPSNFQLDAKGRGIFYVDSAGEPQGYNWITNPIDADWVFDVKFVGLATLLKPADTLDPVGFPEGEFNGNAYQFYGDRIFIERCKVDGIGYGGNSNGRGFGGGGTFYQQFEDGVSTGNDLLTSVAAKFVPGDNGLKVFVPNNTTRNANDGATTTETDDDGNVTRLTSSTLSWLGWHVLDAITLGGAGVGGADLVTTIKRVAPDGSYVDLDDLATANVTGETISHIATEKRVVTEYIDATTVRIDSALPASTGITFKLHRLGEGVTLRDNTFRAHETAEEGTASMRIVCGAAVLENNDIPYSPDDFIQFVTQNSNPNSPYYNGDIGNCRVVGVKGSGGVARAINIYVGAGTSASERDITQWSDITGITIEGVETSAETALRIGNEGIGKVSGINVRSVSVDLRAGNAFNNSSGIVLEGPISNISIDDFELLNPWADVIKVKEIGGEYPSNVDISKVRSDAIRGEINGEDAITINGGKSISITGSDFGGGPIRFGTNNSSWLEKLAFNDNRVRSSAGATGTIIEIDTVLNGTLSGNEIDGFVGATMIDVIRGNRIKVKDSRFGDGIHTVGSGEVTAARKVDYIDNDFIVTDTATVLTFDHVVTGKAVGNEYEGPNNATAIDVAANVDGRILIRDNDVSDVGGITVAPNPSARIIFGYNEGDSPSAEADYLKYTRAEFGTASATPNDGDKGEGTWGIITDLGIPVRARGSNNSRWDAGGDTGVYFVINPS